MPGAVQVIDRQGGASSVPLVDFTVATCSNATNLPGHDRLILEVVPLLKIGQETGLLWMPSKSLLGQGAGRWAVEGENASKKAEASISFAEWHRHNRKVEVAADASCNVAHRYTFVANGVQPCACWRAFQCETEQPCSIKAMHSRPTVRSIARITHDTC